VDPVDPDSDPEHRIEDAAFAPQVFERKFLTLNLEVGLKICASHL
jgi:hypothetical protein